MKPSIATSDLSFDDSLPFVNMLVKSLLFTAIAALSLIPSLASAGPIVVRHEDVTIEFAQDHPNENNELITRKIWLHGFTGCTDV